MRSREAITQQIWSIIKEVLAYSDGSVVFLFLLIYTISMICFAFAVSVFFTKGNTAAAVAGLLWFISYLPYFAIQPIYGTMSYSARMASCLLINNGMALGAQVIGMWEGKGRGAHWNNIGEAVTTGDKFTLGGVLGMLIIDSIVCLVIAWYVEGVFPGDGGIRLPWNFPFTLSYWRPRRTADPSLVMEEGYRIEEHYGDQSCFEHDPKGIDAVIRIRGRYCKPCLGLLREFRVGGVVKTAVNRIHLNMYRGQVTALLGHNGAGKTTTMSMLTGLLEPSGGTAYIDGFDIKEGMEGIRNVTGLCPQYNVLFDNLTVWEHLYLYAKLKGSKTIHTEGERMLESLQMTDKRNALSSTLSGGMKRKLSVGVALIGGSKVVLLDEPTAGMDPNARRSTWDLIQRERVGRSLILTTHYMEEADLLGDRIAIMANGHIRCCGSSLFLKNRYGAGYHLTVMFHPGTDNRLRVLTKLLQDYVPSVHMDQSAGQQASFVLPQESVSKFGDMFRELEKRQEPLGVASFGASVTTMEEVFLRVGEQAGEQKALVDKTEDEDTDCNDLDDFELISPIRTTGVKLIIQQMKALFMKRILHSYRNRLVLIPQLIVPAIMMIMVLVINKTLPGAGVSNPLVLNLVPFEKFSGTNVIHYMNGGNISRSIFDVFPFRNLSTAYTTQFSPEIQSVSVNERLQPNVQGWSILVNDPSSKKFFKHNLMGFQNYLNTTGCYEDPPLGLGKICNGNIERFNTHDILSAYFQLGDAIPDYIADLVALHEMGQMSNIEWYNVSTREIPMLRAMEMQDAILTAVAIFNNEAYHAPAIALSALNSALLRFFSTNKSSDLRFVTTNHPLPATSKDKIAEYRNDQVMTFDIALTVSLAMAFLTSTFIIFLIKERATKAKHLQFVSGAHPVGFWISGFAWDFVNFLIPIFLIMITLGVFDVKAFTEDNRMGMVFVMFVIYGFGALPYMYVSSLLFDNPTVGFVKMTIFNIMSGAGFMMVIGILEIPQLNLTPIRNVLAWIFMTLSPHFCIGEALREFQDNYLSMSTCKPLKLDQLCTNSSSTMACCAGCTSGLCLKWTPDFLQFSSPGVGRYLFFLFLHFLFFSFLLWVKEMGYVRKVEYLMRTRHVFHDKKAEDDDEYSIEYQTYPESVSIKSTATTSEFKFPSPEESGRSTPVSAGPLSLARHSTASESDWNGNDGLKDDWNVIEDPDVSAEQTKVETVPIDELKQGGAVVRLFKNELFEKVEVIMNHLSKQYGDLHAVRSLSLCVAEGECFGLLGVNGAGKTTTFKMLTGDEDISGGDAYINGHSIRKQPKQAQSNLGYCPQFDALIDQMTGYETMEMYARLRGIPDECIGAMADQLISVLGLQKHRNNMVGNYSGGNKRKLSIALALMGNPPVVLLDEPTAGVDPGARRLVWKVLGKITKAGTPIILTSHGMEECEALCSRLAIMVDGKFKCLGSPQHLKAKFGVGYTLLLKVNRARRVPKAVLTIQDMFPGTLVKDIHQRLIHFHMTDNQVPWSRIFGRIENMKGRLNVVDYSVAQTSLEQIFLNFSREQQAKEFNKSLLQA